MADRGVNGEDLVSRLISGDIGNPSDLRSALNLPSYDPTNNVAQNSPAEMPPARRRRGTENSNSNADGAPSATVANAASVILGFLRREPALLVSNSAGKDGRPLSGARGVSQDPLDMRFRALLNKKDTGASQDPTRLTGLLDQGIFPPRYYQNIFQIAPPDVPRLSEDPAPRDESRGAHSLRQFVALLFPLRRNHQIP